MSWISRQQSNLVREEQFVQTAGNAVIRNDIVAKLPSGGLRLNASKSESVLIMRCCSVLPTAAHIQSWFCTTVNCPQERDKLFKCSVGNAWDFWKTIKFSPGIVSVESGLCATIHWNLSQITNLSNTLPQPRKIDVGWSIPATGLIFWGGSEQYM